MTDGPPPYAPYVDPNTGQPVPGYVVDPSTGQPIPDPGANVEQPVANEAFGFQEAPVQEKYNTEYIVSSMQKDQRSSRTLVIGIVIAAILGAVFWALLMPAPEAPSLEPAPEDTPAAPAAEESDDAAKEAPAAEEGDEAKAEEAP
ncbi:MAG: hypothetical protein AAFX94_24745 [Myxococcota bacterium]